MVVQVCLAGFNFYLFFVCRSPSTDQSCLRLVFMIVYWNLWTGISLKIGSLYFFGDLNVHHSEWLGSSRTDAQDVATCDFASLS